MNCIDYIKKNSKISIDSADINFIKKHKIDAITTNPSLILKSILNNTYNKLLYFYFTKNKKKILLDSDYNISFYDKLLIMMISNLSPFIRDKISVEIPARISYNYNKIIFYSYKIIDLCNKSGLNLKKILIKIPATDSGIKAAYELKKNNINSNLTLIFNFLQAKKCFDFGLYLISPFVGRLSDNIYCIYDSGINFVKNLISYKIKNKFKTKIMAASFRNINQILNLTCCDYLTISPYYYNKLLNLNFNFKIKNNFKNFFINKNNIISDNLLKKGIFQFHNDHIRLIKIISNIINNI